MLKWVCLFSMEMLCGTAFYMGNHSTHSALLASLAVLAEPDYEKQADCNIDSRWEGTMKAG